MAFNLIASFVKYKMSRYFLGSTGPCKVKNIDIEFRRGASIKQGAAIPEAMIISDNGATLLGSDLYLNKARFEGFDTAIKINSGVARTTLRDTRYNGHTTTVDDSGTATSELGSIEE